MAFGLERGGVLGPVALPTSEAPAIVIFPTFDRPRAAEGSTAAGVTVTGVVAINFGEDLKGLA